MLSSQLSGLLDSAPAEVPAALDLVTGFDQALEHGLARPDPARPRALADLAGAMAATPLAAAAAEAVDKLATGSVADGHIAALAGARTALLGAAHDSLLAGLDTAQGRTREPLPAAAAAAATGSAADNALAGSRSWLSELAITGWRGVDHEIIAGADQTIDALLADPARRRLAVLLEGLAAELRAESPVATAERLPLRRWADLWARAVLLSQDTARPGPPAVAEQVSGRLLVLGVDVHEHSTAMQVQVHGVLEPAGGAPPRLVRTSVAAAKVDSIVGPAVWRLVADHYPVLLGALAERRALDLTDMPVLDSGDLLWHDDRARAGDPADPFATARLLLAGAAAPAVPAMDRHPVHIAEPVFIEGYKIRRSPQLAIGLDGDQIPVNTDRLPSCGPLTAKLAAASSACIGLLRWDAGQWSVQPLALQATVKRQLTAVHTGDWAMGPTDPKAAKAAGTDAVALLRERAGRLLRK